MIDVFTTVPFEKLPPRKSANLSLCPIFSVQIIPVLILPVPIFLLAIFPVQNTDSFFARFSGIIWPFCPLFHSAIITKIQSCPIISMISRVLQAGKWNFEKSQKRSKMTFLTLKMIIFGHFSRFSASFKILFVSLQHLSHGFKNQKLNHFL